MIGNIHKLMSNVANLVFWRENRSSEEVMNSRQMHTTVHVVVTYLPGKNITMINSSTYSHDNLGNVLIG
jgi:hypothetical protein